VVDLARHIDAAWGAASYREEAFAEIAVGSLDKLAPFKQFSARWLLDEIVLGTPSTDPGDHGATEVVPLHRGPRFAIFAHLWMDSFADPHAHSWTGAYQVIDGSSLEAHYEFSETNRIEPKFHLGDMSIRSIQTRRTGDSVPVFRGRRTIHALCHVERPSVSLSVRSSESYGGLTLDHWLPGIAIQTGFEDNVTVAKMRCLDVLGESDPSRYMKTLVAALERCDPRSAFLLLRHAHTRFRDRDRIDLSRANRVAKRRWRKVGERILAAIESVRRSAIFKERREKLRDHGHRVLLGALYLCPDRRSLFRVIADYYDETTKEAIARVGRAVTELLAKETGRFCLGVPEDPVTDVIVQRLVTGHSFEHVLAGMRSKFADVERARDDVHKLYRAIQVHPVLSALASVPETSR
jgi:hypothetical protein